MHMQSRAQHATLQQSLHASFCETARAHPRTTKQRRGQLSKSPKTPLPTYPHLIVLPVGSLPGVRGFFFFDLTEPTGLNVSNSMPRKLDAKRKKGRLGQRTAGCGFIRPLRAVAFKTPCLSGLGPKAGTLTWKVRVKWGLG